MGLDGLDQFGDALALCGNEFEDGRGGLGPQVTDGLVGALAIGLVDDHEVGDLEQTRLGGLDGVARTGIEDHDGRVGDRGDLDLRLAHSDRLQDDQVIRERGEQPDGRGHRGGQTTKVAAVATERIGRRGR